MKKSLLLFIPLFVSGCPMGNKVNLRPAKATAVGSKICVFFDKNDMEREESILKVAIWKYGNMGIWEYGNMGIWEYGNMGIWEYGNMGIWEYGNMGMWEYGNMEIWKYGNMEIWKYGNMEIWKYGNMEIWKYGNMEMIIMSMKSHMKTRLLHWNRGSVFPALVSMTLSLEKDAVLLSVRLCIPMKPGLSCGNGVKKLC